MYHSITFGELVSAPLPGTQGPNVSQISGKNTWADWHLVPTTRPIATPPSVKTQVVDLPAGDGFIDLSELLTGDINYGSRQGSWAFIAHPDYAWKESWETKYKEILRVLHGKVYKVWLEDDPNYYYEGRFSVAGWQPGANWSQVTINYTLKPFKKELYMSNEPWLWDPFSFVDGVIRNYNEIELHYDPITTTQIMIVTGDERITPEFITTGVGSSASDRIYMSVVTPPGAEGSATGSTSYRLSNGSNIFEDLRIKGRGVTLWFTPTANNQTVTIKYRGGWL